MKRIDSNQEILLFTGSSFSSREFSKPAKDNCRIMPGSPCEVIEQACWAGMLFDRLPELSMKSAAAAKTCIWSILPGEHCLLINQGTGPNPIEPIYSIDPYFLLMAMDFN